ncbi:hypothetical protein RQP46_002821 [Phenoliferia psychrophenolica]
MLGFLTFPLSRASDLATSLPKTKANATSLVSRAWTWVTSSFSPRYATDSLDTAPSPASRHILIASASLTPLLSTSTPPAALISVIVINTTTRGVPTSARAGRAALALRTSSRDKLRTVLGAHHRASEFQEVVEFYRAKHQARAGPRSSGGTREWSSEGSSALDPITGTLTHC